MLRRCFIALLPATAVALLRAPPARAFLVTDVAGLGQLVSQITSTIQQIEATKRQVDSLKNAARTLDPSSYQTVRSLLDGNPVTFDAITRDVTNIGYTLDSVNRQFQRVFPNEDAVHNMHPADYADTSRQMNQELYASALVADRAQTNLSSIEANNNQARDILSRSGADNSQVVQLQSANQMLALVHDNLARITQTISSASRVSSDLAVSGVVDNRIARERQSRYLQGFDRPLNSPGIDPSFLRE